VRVKEEYLIFKEGRPETLEMMYSDLAALGEDPEKLVPPLTRVRNAVDATQASNTKNSRDNEGVHILSVVVYAGDNQAARQASCIIVGDSFTQDIVKENYVDVQKVLNGVADSIRCVLYIGFCLVVFSSLTLFTCRAKKALRNLRMAGGFDLPDDIAALAEKVCPQAAQKPADVAFAVHQKEQQAKKLDRKFMKRLDALDKEVVPPKMNVQYYRSKATSWLKDQYGMI